MPLRKRTKDPKQKKKKKEFLKQLAWCYDPWVTNEVKTATRGQKQFQTAKKNRQEERVWSASVIFIKLSIYKVENLNSMEIFSHKRNCLFLRISPRVRAVKLLEIFCIFRMKGRFPSTKSIMMRIYSLIWKIDLRCWFVTFPCPVSLGKEDDARMSRIR